MSKIDEKKVLEMYQALLARYSPEDAFKALRTEVHAALQLEKPFPYSKRPEHLNVERMLTHAEVREIHLHMREKVTEKEYIASEKARAKGGDHRDAHHHVQKLHGIALWEEADKLVASALKGVK